ncbi:MAG: sugar-binding protein [Sedimentisphaerales bacterium]
MLAKKCLFMGIFTLLNVSLAIADPPAVHPLTGEPLVIDCLRGTPDAIDGDLSDWNLDAMTPAVLDVREQLYMGQDTWDNSDDSSGKFYMLWDDENIYMAVVMKDDKLSMNKTGGDIWNADCIEIFFATTNAVPPHAEHYQYGFNANNQTWNWCNMDSGGQSAIDYLQVASTITADGYICEASIEYGQMLSLDFTAGNNIGFHPVFDDTDDGDRELQMTWTSREAHDQSLGFGYLFLSDAAVTPGFSKNPSPANGAMIENTWVTLGWRAGEFAVSHDVYLGDNFDDVNNGTGDTFIGNQAGTFIVVGFPGFPYPDGLVPGTTYYWRIDEINQADPDSPWKGKIWSFTVPPKTAYEPVPADGAEFVATDATLSWTPGFGAKLHTVYIGTDFDNVNNAAGGAPQGLATYKPASLELEKVYYWRVDEFDALATYKGDVWAFTTPGAAGNPQPSNGSTGVQMTAQLGWTPATKAVSHDVYFGTDKDAVRNATTSSPEYKGNKAAGAESYDPGKLAWHSDYYWRVDAVYNTGKVKGLVLSFTTADFLVVDDFESYNDIDPPDPASNRIFEAWIDGFGTTDNGALVGNDLPPYAEQRIVHGGAQSIPYAYDNNLKTSEATHTLVYPRDWTEEGVTKLSLWFSGASANSAERMFVALNGTAVVYHDEPAVTQIARWTQWVIDLQAFADQGVALTNVNTVTIGFGTKNSPAAGGSGKMYFDDIRLVR